MTRLGRRRKENKMKHKHPLYRTVEEYTAQYVEAFCTAVEACLTATPIP